MAHIIGLEYGIGEEFIVELKSVMDACIVRAIEEDPSISKKSIAMDLGYTQADMSHWLSPKCPKTTMPSHLMPLFCILVRDNSPLWMIQEAYEKGRVTAA